MEIKLPTELEQSMIEEIAYRPGMNKRQFVLNAIRQNVRRCKGNRERGEIQRRERETRIHTGR